MLTHPKFYKGVILLSEHVQEEVSHLKLLQVLHVLWVVCKVGQVGQHLFLCLWQRNKQLKHNKGLFKFKMFFSRPEHKLLIIYNVLYILSTRER